MRMSNRDGQVGQHVHAVEIPMEPSKANQDEIGDEHPGKSGSQLCGETCLSDSTEAKVEPTPASKTDPAMAKPGKKKPRKPIFLSSSPKSQFLERQFVCEMVRELKENNIAEDIWFDRDERNLTSVTWLSERLEIAERCRAAICVLSKDYLQSPPTIYELRILLERQASHNPPKVFLVLLEELDLPEQFQGLTESCVNLAVPGLKSLSAPEMAAIAVGSLIAEVEQFAVVRSPYRAPPRNDSFTCDYKKESVCYWTIHDLQSWLFDLGMKEFYRQNFAELFVDGYLMMSLIDRDIKDHLGVGNGAVRKKLIKDISALQDKEQHKEKNWHLRARNGQRLKPDQVYFIYDPADVRLAQNLKRDLKSRGFLALSHDKLGQSREEFLRNNGPVLATCKTVVVLMTEAACSSPFVFHEVLFADWLGKSVMTLMFKNVWSKLRPSLKAILGERMAVDFERQMYNEGIDVLEHHIKPTKSMIGVVLEQDFLNRMDEGLRPLSVMASLEAATLGHVGHTVDPCVYISYQWDAQNKVAEIRRILEANDIRCFADSSSTVSQSHKGGNGTNSVRNSVEATDQSPADLQRSLKSSTALACVVTPSYLQSEICVKDLALADSLDKPIVPVLLRFVSWPPEMSTPSLKKIWACTTPVDLSNDKLFKQNAPVLVDRLNKHLVRAYKEVR